MIASLYVHLTRLTGWRRNLAAYLLGVCLTLAMPPVFLFPMLVPAFTGLLWLIQSADSKQRAFADGWWWGWGFFMTGLYWMCIALLTEPERFAWMLPFALLGLNAVIALYPACAALIVYLTRSRGFASLFLFTAVFTAVEMARGHWFTGFPWNLPGYAWAFSDAASQSVSVIGIYGLSFLTVLIAAAPAVLAYGVNVWPMAALWCGFALIAAAGQWRLAEAGEPQFVPGVMLRLVQPNISQPHKWRPERQAEVLKKHADLTMSEGIGSITHVIWPETAVPYALEADSALAHALSRLVPPDGALITGALRAEGEGEEWRLWNSLLAVDGQGGFAAVYDKHHLVPFGEYVPLRALIPVSADKLIAGFKDFEDGRGAVRLEVPGLPPALPLICYEAIFPGFGGREAAPKPGWLLNVTNDAWFGSSSGPYQHFHMSRMRAIELGLPLVRVANTGISGVTDAYGRVMSALPLNVAGKLDVRMPVMEENTIYGRFSNNIALLLIIICAILGGYLKRNLRF